jgi:hypothetical protein
MYDDIKKNMVKVRKNKHTNHQSNQNSVSNYGRQQKGNRFISTEPESSQSSSNASNELSNANLMGHFPFNMYGPTPNSVEQLQLQMQMRMMTMGNPQNGRCENYPTFIRKAVESSDECEEQ